MRENDSAKSWWEDPKVVIWVLGIVAGGGLLAVILPLGVNLGGSLSSKDARFYITEVGVPLLTFAGFLAVYLGFLNQREQNELQKLQIETQRRQIEAQQENFQKDRFESTFFQLLRTQNQIVNDIRIEQKKRATQQKGRKHPLLEELEEKLANSSLTYGSGEESVDIIQIHGRSCFEYFYTEFEKLFTSKADKKDWGDLDSAKEGKVRWVYANWFADRKSDLNHYFSHLSKLISFVHRSDVEDKQFYIDLITAQMSIPEQKLFFYHINLMKDESNHRHLRDAYDVLGEYTFFKQVDKGALAHDLHYRINKAALGME